MLSTIHDKVTVAQMAAIFALIALFPAKSAFAQEQSSALGLHSVATQMVADKPLAVLSTTSRRWWKDSDGSFHFTKGIRWVPVARGAAQKRAQALGLTSLQAIRDLLHNGPSKEILEAAGDEVPKTLLWPVVKGTWGRGFGYTRKLRPELRHNGIDIGAPLGAPVRASAAGIVVYSDNELEGFGNCVIIAHPNGWVTTYAHNLRNTVQAGWRVKRGERIALIGSTGASWGPHLHFELRRWGGQLDPERYITGNRSLELNGPLVDLSKPATATPTKKPRAASSKAGKTVLQPVKRDPKEAGSARRTTTNRSRPLAFSPAIPPPRTIRQTAHRVRSEPARPSA